MELLLSSLSELETDLVVDVTRLHVSHPPPSLLICFLHLIRLRSLQFLSFLSFVSHQLLSHGFSQS